MQQLTHSPCQAEQLTARKVFVPELHDIGAATLRRPRYAKDVLRLSVRCDDVQKGGLKPLAGRQVRSWRSFCRNAGGVSQPHESLTSRFRFVSNV
jgi:hypothetical protein